MFARLKRLLRPSTPDVADTNPLINRHVPETGNAVLGQETAAKPARGDLADRRSWTFEWPTEALEREAAAVTSSFAVWLYETGETDLSRRQLTSLYFEYVEVHELRPLPWSAFDKSLKAAGILRHRTSLPGRPWRYRVAEPHKAIVYKIDRRAA